jgi:hypothetical protein
MTIILPSSDIASLSSLIICCNSVGIFNVSLSGNQGTCTDKPVFWIICHGRCCCRGVLQDSPICLRCLWLLVLSWRSVTAKKCSVEVSFEKTFSQRIPWKLVVIFSFAVLSSHTCSIRMMLDGVSLILLVCNSKEVGINSVFFFQSNPYAAAPNRVANIERIVCCWPKHDSCSTA